MSQVMDAVEVTLSERIDLERRRRGWSWAEVAKQMGVASGTLDGWRRGEWKRIRLDQALQLAKTLGIDARLFVPDAEDLT